MALLVLSLFMMLTTLMSGSEAQISVSDCNVLFKELTGKGFRVFVNLLESEAGFPGASNELCVDFSAFRLDRYYYCREGFSAFLPRVDTPDNMNDLSKVIDVDSLRDQLNETADPQLFFCVPRPPPPTPSPSPPPPSPPSVGSCPRGPTRVNQYLRQDQSKLCLRTCSFGTAVFGISTGSRTRRIYRCCDGEPILVSRASRLYRCP